MSKADIKESNNTEISQAAEDKQTKRDTGKRNGARSEKAEIKEKKRGQHDKKKTTKDTIVESKAEKVNSKILNDTDIENILASNSPEEEEEKNEINGDEEELMEDGTMENTMLI